MSRYLIQASYNAAGVKGVIKEGGTSRKAAVEKAVAGWAAGWRHFTLLSGGGVFLASLT